MDEFFDVVIVGTGAAGLYCALNLPERLTVLILTKRKADESDSFLAQGGICMLRGEEDFHPYMEDTLRAGHYENDRDAVDLMIRSSNSIIRIWCGGASGLPVMGMAVWILPGRELTAARGSSIMKM